MKRWLDRIAMATSPMIGRSRKLGWRDLLVLLGFAGLAFMLFSVANEWTGTLRPTVEIDLSPLALPKYTLFSLSRGLLAYGFSLAFTLVYGYWAAKDKVAERVLVPFLDVLQSVPVLGFMPGLVLALTALFPSSNVGLELASVLLIFTGQAWNMTFSFYHSLRSVPRELQEAGTVYRFSWWERFRHIELPFATMGLVWNSMMSMAGGWFFLMITEAFVLGHRDFRLPGIGSYMSVAVHDGNGPAMLWAVLAMTGMIVALDQLLWRPIVVWAQKFRIEESSHEEIASSWFLDWLRRSEVLNWAWRLLGYVETRAVLNRRSSPRSKAAPRILPAVGAAVSRIMFLALMGALGLGALKLILLIRHVSGAQWLGILAAAGLTLSRVLAATALGTLWALPAGLAIGLAPRLSRVLQPVVQVLASFPAPMLFPLAIALMHKAGVSLGWGSIVLMLLGTQWYILFNVIAGAMAVPADLREAARSFRLRRGQRFWGVYVPAVFPYLVTGWITAAGGAWNASIVAEYVTFKGRVIGTLGLGAQISEAAETAQFPLLAASVVFMSVVVVLFNQSVWRRCYRVAEERFSLSG